MSAKPSSLSIMTEFLANPIYSQGNRRSSTGWATYLEPILLGSSIPHAQALPPSFSFLQVGSLSWVLAS